MQKHLAYAQVVSEPTHLLVDALSTLPELLDRGSSLGGGRSGGGSLGGGDGRGGAGADEAAKAADEGHDEWGVLGW